MKPEKSAPIGAKQTINSLIEDMGMTKHHWQAAGLVWWIFFLSGWVYSMSPYWLDAVGSRDSDWIVHTGASSQRMHDWQKSLTMLLAGVAGMIGNPFVGYLADTMGRVFTMVLGVLLISVAMLGFAFSYSWQVLIVFACMAPFGRDGTGPIGQSLIAEWVPMRERGWLIVFGHASFNFGRLALTILWLLLPPSDNWIGFFLAAAAVPAGTFLILSLIGWKYESPRWLALIGDAKRCEVNIKLAAESSGHTLPEGWDEPDFLELEASDEQNVRQPHRNKWNPFAELRHHGMKKEICLLSICFFCVSYGSWGSFLWTIDYLKAIEANDAINAVVMSAPIAKILGNILLIVKLRELQSPLDYFGRLTLIKAGYLGFSVFLLLICKSGTSVVLITASYFLAMMAEEVIWTVGSTYAVETFPTGVRATAMSIIMTVCAAGGILSNAIGLQLLRLWEYLPLVVMASCCFVGLVACHFLPDDRKDMPLMDTFAEKARTSSEKRPASQKEDSYGSCPDSRKQ